MDSSRSHVSKLTGCLSRPLTESDLALIWQIIIPRLKNIRTVSGEKLLIISPGYINRFSGPDIRKAKIKLGKIVKEGAVEIHRRPVDWYHHSHHRDEAYNSVILHFCLFPGKGCPIQRPDKQLIARLSGKEIFSEANNNSQISWLGRKKYSRDLLEKKPPCSRVKLRCNNKEFGKILEKYGSCWLMSRAAQLNKLPPERRLWQNFVESLGYTANHGQFRCLARRLTPEEFYRRISDTGSSLKLASWLMGVGGWLERPFSGQINRAIYYRRRIWETEYQDSKSLVQIDNWNRRSVRPHCYPLRRWLVFGRASQNLGIKWENWVDKLTLETCAEDLRDYIFKEWSKYFSFPAGGYWNFHYTRSDKRHESVPSPAGESWFDQLIVNTVLPWLYSKAIKRGSTSKRKIIEKIYKTYPPVLKNRRTKEVLIQANRKKFNWSNVFQQQGAVFLYKVKCRRGLCGDCFK